MWDMYGQPHVDSSAATFDGVPRCYDFFLEHRKCWVQADRPSDCLSQRRDYIECVYNAKEARRMGEVAARAATLREERAKKAETRTGEVVPLGIINAVDYPEEPDYPGGKYPDDAQSRGMGYRGAGHVRGWASEKEQKKVETKDGTAAPKPEGEDNVPPAQG